MFCFSRCGNKQKNSHTGLHLENYPGVGGNWRNLNFKEGGMMVKDVTKFHKCHLGGRSILECVYVCRVSKRIFGRGGAPKFSVCVAHDS